MLGKYILSSRIVADHYMSKDSDVVGSANNSNDIGASVIIRTLNEAHYLPKCLKCLQNQKTDMPIEIILVDSGSIDNTIEIARSFGCRIVQIDKNDFSFGRALNIGIRQAQYPIIVAISAHCIPLGRRWLSRLVSPIIQGVADMVYGGQLAPRCTRTSEIGYFNEKFLYMGGIQQKPLLNNGNSAFLRRIWHKRPFDEYLPAQEDMEFALWHMQDNAARLYYARQAKVVHYHNDRNKTLFDRLYRELSVEFYLGQKTALRLISFLISVPACILQDLAFAHSRGVMLGAAKGILAFRAVQVAAYFHAYRTHVKFVSRRA
jgi:rhamnosyltransferase